MEKPIVQGQMAPLRQRWNENSGLQVTCPGSRSQPHSCPRFQEIRGAGPTVSPGVWGQSRVGDLQTEPDVLTVSSVPSQPAGRDPEKKVTVATRIPPRVSHGREEPWGGWDLEKVSKVDSFSRHPPSTPPSLCSRLCRCGS